MDLPHLDLPRRPPERWCERTTPVAWRPPHRRKGTEPRRATAATPTPGPRRQTPDPTSASSPAEDHSVPGGEAFHVKHGPGSGAEPPNAVRRPADRRDVHRRRCLPIAGARSGSGRRPPLGISMPADASQQPVLSAPEEGVRLGISRGTHARAIPSPNDRRLMAADLGTEGIDSAARVTGWHRSQMARTSRADNADGHGAVDGRHETGMER